MADWAEGSGSTWESLDGDPRIVVGAEVLVGRHRPVDGEDNWGPMGMTPRIGCRHIVEEVEQDTPDCGCRNVRLDGKACGYVWRTSDLVCLRTADGELTEEGRVLENWNIMLSNDGDECQYVLDPKHVWAARAGVFRGSVEPYQMVRIDRDRLDMALGRDVSKIETYTWTTSDAEFATVRVEMERMRAEDVAAERPALEAAVKAALEAPVMCHGCGRQPVSPKTGPRCFCGDCATPLDELFAKQASGPALEPRSDYSGESHLDALRSWIRRPMGTR